jgi:hypothetical protein
MTKRRQNLSEVADRLAAEYRGNPFDPKDPIAWDYFRDWVDLRTGSSLDYQPLNILTDMAAQRIAAKAAA